MLTNNSSNQQILEDIRDGKEAFWMNPDLIPYKNIKDSVARIVSDEDIRDAADRLDRFCPFLEKVFPETADNHGLIESELHPIPDMQRELSNITKIELPGQLCLKMDSHLPIAGSVKARGGIYEVLLHAETLAKEAGLLRSGESYACFAEPEFQQFFSDYKIQVGSTGNLGMSIGIMAAALGFQAIVHMSSDAMSWKKALLRARGVEVIEYAGDYTQAVSHGRKESEADPKSYFVDDENSKALFLGYAVAAGRLKKQLEERHQLIDSDHPLIVYLPAGVGGAPGGISYGLKRIFGDNVYCCFAEPVECPSVLLGIASDLYEKADVRNFGRSGKTAADGLACPSPSGLVTRMMKNLLNGAVTVSDERLIPYLKLLFQSENIFIEPSSCAAFHGPVKFMEVLDADGQVFGIPSEKLEQSVQIVWATGGNLVPDSIRYQILNN